MTTEFVIFDAVFQCKTDEDIFYQRISEITGIRKVIVKATKLHLTVDDKEKKKAVKEISAICDRWLASYSMIT